MADAVRTRQVSAAALAQAALARARALVECNCFCYLLDDSAAAVAGEIDRALADGERLDLPLLGVPFAAKDMTPTAGVPATLGSWTSGDAPATETALVVDRLQQAGAVLIGKTTTPEFANSGFTGSPRWGVTRNPHDPRRSPGGSSGGSGAAVAGGCVPFAEGTDMGGSVRIPAALCGVVGLKPSLGRIPMTILPSLFDNISHFGPLARRVDDAVAFMAATSGPSDEDPFSVPLAFDAARARRRPALAGRRFAFSMDLGFYAVADEVQAVILDAIARLRRAGAVVDIVDLRWTRDVVDRWTDLWGVFMAAYFGDRRARFAARMDPAVLALMERGDALGATEVKRIELLRSAMWRDMMRVLDNREALLCPTCAVPAPPVEETDDDYMETLPDGRFRGLDLTAPFNMVPALPALSLPAGYAGGLPVGLQMVGRRYGDEALLGLAGSVEALLGVRTLPPRTSRSPMPTGSYSRPASR